MSRTPRELERSFSPPVRSTTPPFVEKTGKPAGNPVVTKMQPFLDEAGAMQGQHGQLLAQLNKENKGSFTQWLNKNASRSQDFCIGVYHQLIAQSADDAFSAITAFSVSIYSAISAFNSTQLVDSSVLEQLKAKKHKAYVALDALRNFRFLTPAAILRLIQDHQKQRLTTLLILEAELTTQSNAVDTGADQCSCITDKRSQCQIESAYIRLELDGLKLAEKRTRRPCFLRRLSDSFSSGDSADSFDGHDSTAYFQDRLFPSSAAANAVQRSTTPDDGSSPLSRRHSDDDRDYFSSCEENGFNRPVYF